jgi:Uma2 family endonuclease
VHSSCIDVFATTGDTTLSFKTKGRADMTTTSDRLAVVTPADWVPGSRQGEWTYGHYAALPDDGKRYEIVNGVLYMSPSPSIPHQRISGRIFRYLSAYVEDAGLGLVLEAPTDVILSPNNVFQPDVFVVLNTGLEKIKDLYVAGAPDLVVEVSSPSTAIHDRNKKYYAYSRAGVTEYWIVDPGTRSVEVLTLEGGEYLSLGVFRGQATLPSKIVPAFSVHVEQFFPRQ